jgi:hypothetical protein
MTRRLDAEKLARLYDGFYAESSEPMPKIITEWHLHEDAADMARDPSHTSPLETIAGFAVLALVGLLFWGVM